MTSRYLELLSKIEISIRALSDDRLTFYGHKSVNLHYHKYQAIIVIRWVKSIDGDCHPSHRMINWWSSFDSDVGQEVSDNGVVMLFFCNNPSDWWNESKFNIRS